MKIIEAIKTNNFKTLIKEFTGFDYQPKKNRLKYGNNNYFDLDTLQAVSYGWWVYFRFIDGIAVFNKHRYSATTSKHQSYMNGLLSDIKIYIDVRIDTRANIQYWSIEDLEKQLKAELASAQLALEQCVRKVSNKRKLAERKIENLQWYLERVQEKIQDKKISASSNVIKLRA